MSHILLVYRRSRGELMQTEEFGSDSFAAMKRRHELEKQHRSDPDVEVVVLSGESPEAIKRTHARYFKRFEQLTEDVKRRAGMKLTVHWVGAPPPDAPDWERIIQQDAEDTIGVGAVKIRNVGDRWWIEGARIGHVGVGMGPRL